MCDNGLEIEKDAVDYITNCMLSVNFLQNISDVIFGSNRNEVSVGEFYDRWLQATTSREHKIPFNPGVILAYLYCGILWAKEHWFDLLPNVVFDEADTIWGFTGVECHAPRMSTPTFKDVVKRVRNALAHGNFTIEVPENIDRSEFLTRIICHFHDENIRDREDIFDINVSMEQLFKFIKAFHALIHSHVRSNS